MLHTGKKKVFLVEDEVKVAGFIRSGLEESGFEVDMAFDGVEGQRKALENYYDLLIIDINLPLINGIELCRKIRQHNTRVPILMLTARSSTEDKVTGFEAGADDYLIKPFAFAELVVRIKSLLKRLISDDIHGNVLHFDDLELNINSKTVKRAGQKIVLTAREFTLLEFLMKNQGRVVSRAEIAESVWDINFDTGTNVIDVYVNFLRKKISLPDTRKIIHTVIGMGYVMREEA